jgi:hypothetical protein
MVNKKDITDRNFTDIIDYYEHILNSDINGQTKQAKSLYQKMSVKQKEEFRDYYEHRFYDSDSASITATIKRLNNG